MVTADIRSGDVLFVWGSGIVNDAIEWVTHGPSHVAMFIDDNTLCEAQGGRPIGDCPLSFYTDSTDRLEVWSDESLTDDEREKMVSYAKTLYGVEYDYALIPLELLHFETGLNIDWYHEKKRRLCSTFIYDTASKVDRIWSKTINPAPVDLIKGGVLQKKGDLVSKSRTSILKGGVHIGG